MEQEFHGIQNVLDGRVLYNQAFNAESFRAALEQRPPIVHVASHFTFSPGDEENSSLLLGDGSELTLAEIRKRYRFVNVDLVSLSACETGKDGKDEKDENGVEVEGLGVIVQKRGAKGVLATLWKVDDKSTGEFMRLFYDYWRHRGLTKAKALQKAQLAFIHGEVDKALAEVAARGKFTDASGKAVEQPPTPKEATPDHPYYWAPFILMGNWL